MYRIFTLVMLLCALSPQALAAPDFPLSFQTNYSLHSKGARIAEMQRVMRSLGDGKFHYRSETRTTGLIALFRSDHIVEESTWMFSGESLRPLHYLYRHEGGKKDRNVAVDFDWENRRITNTINGDSWLMPAEPDVMDKLLYQFAIMFDLNAGRTPRQYTVADGGKIKLYEFEALGEETIDTPLGKLRTLKFSRYREGSERETTLWCAPELNFLPVKVENVEKDGFRTVALIDSVTGLACPAGGPQTAPATACGQ